jgi:outer membrane receptor protein involved in Fe transport
MSERLARRMRRFGKCHVSYSRTKDIETLDPACGVAVKYEGSAERRVQKFVTRAGNEDNRRAPTNSQREMAVLHGEAIRWPLIGRWTARVGGAYRYTGWQYLGTVESASSPASFPTVRIPGYSVTDLHSSIQDDHLTFSFYVHNLANSRALTGAGFTPTTNPLTGVQAVNITDLQPRTLALGVDYAF